MVRTIIADYPTALTAAQAITAALFAKERSGVDQRVQIAMLDSMIPYLWPEAMPSLTFIGEEQDPSEGELGTDLIFATQDRYITAGALSDEEWAGMCRASKREDLIDDPRFKSRKAPKLRLKWNCCSIGALARTQDVREAIAAFSAQRAPVFGGR